MEEKTNSKKKNTLSIIILIIAIIIGTIVYSKYNYNDFTKSVREKGKTSFSRDANIKYSKTKSYKVQSKEYNDAIFYQNVEVKPNTAYKVTCMVKTKDIECENSQYECGAQIGIKDSLECSKSILGTNDWTELTFMFNSKKRTNVDIGFRLGGSIEKAKGTAWFSDFKIQEGNIDSDNKWNVACFLLQNIDVNVTLNNVNRNVKLKMTDADIYNMEADIARIPDSIKNISNGKVEMNCDIIKINTPLTSISYDEDYEYYIDSSDVQSLIEKYIDKKEYDYIYVITRLGDINTNRTVLVHDWIGLGGMDYYGIGYSNIRLPDDENNYTYKYDNEVNTFPEEVFIHEFLHTLERNEKEYENNNIEDLHNYERYGYKLERKEGLQEWYKGYMQNTIKNADGKNAGLTQNAYLSKPIHESNFKYSYELNELKEPQNAIERINSIVNRIKKLFK